jgi:aminoglycoside phosphotransferase (APT) family kinase protein
LMDHPNIAHVLDAGATETGRPYFVMELVQGVKITDYCNDNYLDTAQRLGLFTQVCHAVQHAHQKGVIHRDIKPSNILVTLHNGVAVPKVIDFGIAKATEGRLTDNTVFTAYNHFIGTPAYMSPEQAEMTGLDVDTRSDIYSLGILLYELLTGKTPFDNHTLMQSGLDAMRQTLRDKEPLPPSRFISSFRTEELTQTALHRDVEPPRLISQLKGDVDWIVMKALEKDRSQRYETANGLAADVKRYLDNEPVTARPPSRIYRLRKLVRRNKAVFVSGAAVSAALIVGLGLSTWLFFKERASRREAERGRANEMTLRQQAEAQVVIGQAAMLLGQDRYEDADRLLAGSLSLETVLGGETVLRPLGDWDAVHGRWKRASDCYAVLTRVDQIRVDQMETRYVATLDDTRYAVTLVETGDRDGYERFRQAAVRRFSGTTNPVVAERTVKNSLVLPGDEKLLALLAPLAEVAKSESPVGSFAWRCLSLALMDYRRGHYVESAAWCKRCLSYSHDKQLALVATIRAIYAMSFYQQGQPQNALAQLAESHKIIESKFSDGADLGNAMQGYWFDWELGRILEREAALLIGEQKSPVSTTTGDRN